MIHRFTHNGVYIVLDVNSGSVHIMDELAYEIAGLLESGERLSDDEIINKLRYKFSNHPRFEINIREAVGEIRALIEDGRLFSPDIFENAVPQKKGVVKALCLHIAHDCNLRCEYCFAGKGGYRGERSLMSAETGKRALEFLVENSGARRNLEVDFFGGEPTINFGVVTEIVRHGRELEKIHNINFRFTLTTNAFSLNDEIISFANDNMSNVVLSIDGRRETNDRMRKDASGRGSYDKILPNIVKLVRERGEKNYYLRGTFTRSNLDFAEDTLHLYRLGFKQLSLEPVVAPEGADYALRAEDIPEITREYDRLAEISLEHRDLNFFHFNIDLSGGSCALKRISGCGAGCEYMAVTPEGDLYPCHQLTGEEGFWLGTVYGGVENSELSSRLAGVNIYSKESCKGCWAKFYCSGGCAANSYHSGGDISADYEIGCALQKKRVECALYIKAKESLKPLTQHG